MLICNWTIILPENIAICIGQASAENSFIWTAY